MDWNQRRPVVEAAVVASTTCTTYLLFKLNQKNGKSPKKEQYKQVLSAGLLISCHGPVI